MPTFIIYLESSDKSDKNPGYAGSAGNIDSTIDDLEDKTDPKLIDEIIVCDDINIGYERDGVNVISSSNIGKASAWNIAAKQARSQILFFLRDTTKFSDAWVEPLIDLLSDHKSLVSPIIYSLDTNLWCSDQLLYRKFGWRWDLEFYNRESDDGFAASISPFCFGVHKKRLEYLEWFDDDMGDEDGECLELSIRNWLFGGNIRVSEDSTIAVESSIANNDRNLARIVEAWLPSFADYFYAIRGISPSDVNVGKLDNLVNLQNKQEVTADDFLIERMPELVSLYNIRGIANGKSVAVIGNGPSIDDINPSLIYRNNIIIGIDYMGELFDCDYVVTDDTNIVSSLKKKYSNDQFIVPRGICSNEFTSYELGRENDIPGSIDPPFANFGSNIHPAIHLALFMNPREITIFGCDNKIIDGKSHSAKIECYDNGKLWKDSDAIRRRFAVFEYGIDKLGKVASNAGISLIRMNHA